MPVTRVLHSGGNFRHLHPLAAHPAVDAIEADVWVRSGRLVAHNGRPLGTFPLMLHSDGVSFPPFNPVRLDELVQAAEGLCALAVDLRSWFGDPAPDCARELMALRDRIAVSVTCESWTIADRLRAWVPDLRVAYSVRSEQQLRRYVGGRSEGSIEAVPVAVRHTLLHSAAEAASLRGLAGHVAVWTVDEIDRAIELVRWGVDEIVSSHLDVLNAV